MNVSRFQHALKTAVVAVIPFLVVACGSDSPSGPTNSAPKVTSVSPTSGSTTGGSSITISGTGFASDATVSVGGVPATGVVVSGSTSITAMTGVRTTAGAAEVTVVTGGRTSTLSNAFTFVAPSGTNRPPVISAFRSIGSRNNQPSGFADIDETVQVLATVTDSETSNASLTYEWTAPGTLTPSGPTLTWKIPSSIANGTPSTVTVGLTVTEKFIEGGVSHTQSTSGTFPMRVHDSQKEIMDAGEDFLLLFSDSTKSTNEVLRNFSTTCDGGKGRQSEANDTDRNRGAVHPELRGRPRDPASAGHLQLRAAGMLPRRPPAAELRRLFVVHGALGSDVQVDRKEGNDRRHRLRERGAGERSLAALPQRLHRHGDEHPERRDALDYLVGRGNYATVRWSALGSMPRSTSISTSSSTRSPRRQPRSTSSRSTVHACSADMAGL